MKQNKSFFFYIIYLCFLFVCFWCYFLLGFRFLLFCLTSPNRWWDNHVANLEYQMLDTKLNSVREREREREREECVCNCVCVFLCFGLKRKKERGATFLSHSDHWFHLGMGLIQTLLMMGFALKMLHSWCFFSAVGGRKNQF